MPAPDPTVDIRMGEGARVPRGPAGSDLLNDQGHFRRVNGAFRFKH
jgi:hypothetical protein